MIKIDELESYLWGAAVDLRGQIDAAAYKEYIFPLVFLKRISDVYDEEYAGHKTEAMSMGYSDEEACIYASTIMEESAIKIPDGAHWKDVFEQTENIGQKLVDVFNIIENANKPQDIDGRLVGGLEGIFGDKSIWKNKTKMPDSIIRNMLNNFNRLTLSIAECPADEMGTGYEYLIGKFADDAGHTAQEFYTNRTVVELMAEILQLKSGESIYDPTCGSGGMLIKSLSYLREKGEEWRDVKVYGQELNTGTSAIARMNCYLHGVNEFSIINADTLENPAFIKDGKVQQFDVVLANPPYSISTWNREKFEHDRYGRCFLGCPPQSRADYAFIQHIVASMDNNNGRCAVLLPHGVLNRGEEKDIRYNLIKTDCIDAIIGLGRNLFFNSGLESFILLCSNRKTKERKGKILFIEAEHCTHKEGKQAYLYPDDIKKIVHAYNNLEDEEGFSKWVDIKDIEDGNLNIKSYVKAVDNGEYVSLKSSLSEYLDSQSDLCESLNNFDLISDKCEPLEIESIETDINKSTWKRVKLGQVASEYSARIDNPSESQYDFYIGSDCIGQYDFTINKRSSARTITSAQKEFKVGDYLLVRRSLYGSDFRERAPRADFAGCCSADILTIRENPKYIYDGYLLFVLYSKDLWDFIVANSTGGLTRRIKWKQLEEFEFDLPSLSEQKRLAEKLWAAYEVKQSYLKMIEATDEMVKSQFIEMFGEITNTIPLSNVIEETYPGEWGKDDEDGTGIKVIRTTNFTNKGTLDLTDVVTRSIDQKKIDKKKLRKGDIILERSGGTNENPVGRVVYFNEDGDFLFNNFTQLLRCKDEINSMFVFYSLFYYYQANKAVIRSMGNKTTGIQNLKMDQYWSIPIADVSNDLQQQFIQIAQQADKSKLELRKSIESIDAVIMSLINENI